jgi:hypothetical protein
VTERTAKLIAIVIALLIILIGLALLIAAPAG